MDKCHPEQRAADLQAHACARLRHDHADAAASDLTLFWKALERMRASGYRYVSLTIAADHTGTGETLRTSFHLRALLARRRGLPGPQRRRYSGAAAEGKLAVGLNFQGTVPIGRRSQLILIFYKLGIRHMLIAYNSRETEWVPGVTTRCGRRAHAVRPGGDPDHESRACWSTSSTRAIEHPWRRSRRPAPVVVSHGNVWALHQHPRCYRDEQLKAVAAPGGVFGITGFGLFLGPGDATVEQFVRHLDHVAQLVACSTSATASTTSTTCPPFRPTPPLEAPSSPKQAAITALDSPTGNRTKRRDNRGSSARLFRRGRTSYPGGNWLRVLAQVWR